MCRRNLAAWFTNETPDRLPRSRGAVGRSRDRGLHQPDSPVAPTDAITMRDMAIRCGIWIFAGVVLRQVTAIDCVPPTGRGTHATLGAAKMLRDGIVARHRLRNVYAEAITSDVFMKAVRSGRRGPDPTHVCYMVKRQTTGSACAVDAARRHVGTNNNGRSETEARDQAIAAGIAINGLPIVRDKPDIAAYYSQNVIGGEAAFVTIVGDSPSFHTAVLKKFVTEIAQIGAQSRSG